MMRAEAAKAGRDPKAIGITTTCPGLSPKAGSDPRSAIEERAALGVSRVIVPVTPFMADLETGLAAFGEKVIRPFATA
jgi:hypothetical protein